MRDRAYTVCYDKRANQPALGPGSHKITLTATDSQGTKNETSVTLNVGTLYLPHISKQ